MMMTTIELSSFVRIHHKHCAILTFQLSTEDGLQQPHRNKLLTRTLQLGS